MMIEIRDLEKRYPNQDPTFQHFNISFDEHGFVLLIGESGSGKTTLLNLIAGLIPFEAGTITYQGKTESGIAPMTLRDVVEYITQDNYFIDFISVKDNLLLTGRSQEEIDTLLEQFGIIDNSDCVPSMLSGGERARLALVRALLSEKSILLLDEPTAALDSENKKSIFSLLSKMGEDNLILCATHDEDAISYADLIVRLHKDDKKICIKKTKKYQKNAGVNSINKLPVVKNTLPSLTPFLLKWFSSTQRNKTADRRFFVFLVFAICLIFFGDTPNHKIIATTRDLYRSTVLQLTLPKDIDIMSLGIDETDIIEIDLSYRGSCPSEDMIPLDNSGLLFAPPDYVTNLRLLPDREDAFPLINRLIEGTYFSGTNQTIITEQMAEVLSPGNVTGAVGKTITTKAYGLGKLELKIVGVLGNLTLMDCARLNGIGAEIPSGDKKMLPQLLESVFFISAETFQPLQNNDNFFFSGGAIPARRYMLFFKSTNAMIRFQENWNKRIDSLGGSLKNTSLPQIVDSWENNSRVFLFIAALVMIFTLLFYGQLHRTELIHNNNFISVLEHMGYKKKQILNCLIRIDFQLFFIRILLAVVFSTVLMSIANLLNRKLFWFPLDLFSFDVRLVLIAMVVTNLGVVLLLWSQLGSVRSRTWYDNLTANRDIL